MLSWVGELMSDMSRVPVLGPVTPPVGRLVADFEVVAAQALVRGLGSADGHEADLAALAELHQRLGAEIARRMAVLETEGGATVGVSTLLVGRGWAPGAARRMRVISAFTDRHPDLAAAWRTGRVAEHQVVALARLPRKLTAHQTAEVVAALLPVLPGMGARETSRAVQRAVDLLSPDDPDEQERSDYDARHLVWSPFRGGLVFSGYLPAAEAGAFTAAVDACAEEFRVAGSPASVGQRRADGLASLVSKAAAHGLPSGGGVPATLALTVSLTEAERVAARDPAAPPPTNDRMVRDPRSLAGILPAGDAAVRFGLCCAAVSPVLVADQPSGTEQPAGTEQASGTDQPAGTEPPAGTGQLPVEGGGLLGRLLDTPVLPLAVGRAVRLASPAQRIALRLRDGGCVIPGCAVNAAYTQPHHVTPWSLGGRSDLRNLASLCWAHHRQVDQGRWDLLNIDDVPGPDDLPIGSQRRGVWWIVPLDATERRRRRDRARRAC